MSCFSCIPPPASLKPRKIYNILVPDVFPIKCPANDDPIPNAIQKKIGKLQEYIQRNPERIPKVSRRLNRRLQRAIFLREIGYIRIAVAAYAQLLEGSLVEDSSYTLTYFSKELTQGPDAVISTLVNDATPTVQALGADLLVVYIRSQTDVDHQVAAVESLMGSIVRIMLGRGPKASEGNSVEGKVMAATVEATKISCIRAIKEYINFCHRLKVLPLHLEDIEECILVNLPVNLDLSSQDVQKSLHDHGNPSEERLGHSFVGTQARASELALSTLQCFNPFLQDISMVYRVLQTLLSYLDNESRWNKEQFVESLLGIIKHACGDQTFPLFTSLMRHCSEPGLAPLQRSAIIKFAVTRGSPYSLSAMSLALTELPKALLAEGINSIGGLSKDQKELKERTFSAVQFLAKEVNDVAQLCDALAGSLKQYASVSNKTHPTATLTLECVLTALRMIPNLKHQYRLFPSRSFPATLIHHLSLFLTDSAMPISTVDRVSHSLALDALLLVLVAVKDGGSPTLDERSASSLLATARTLAGDRNSGPKALEVASRLTECVSMSIIPSIQLQLARTALAVKTLTLQDSSWSPVRVAAGLILSNTVLAQLGKAIMTPGAVQALQSPGLESLQLGVVSSSGIVMTTADMLLEVSEEAARAVEAERASEGINSWADRFLKALLTRGSISEVYGHNFSLLPSEFEPQPALSLASHVTAPLAQVRVDYLPERIAASWGDRRGSLCREDVNLEKVLELLEDVKDGADVAIVSAKKGRYFTSRATIKDVLDMVANITLHALVPGNPPAFAAAENVKPLMRSPPSNHKRPLSSAGIVIRPEEEEEEDWVPLRHPSNQHGITLPTKYEYRVPSIMRKQPTSAEAFSNKMSLERPITDDNILVALPSLQGPYTELLNSGCVQFGSQNHSRVVWPPPREAWSAHDAEAHLPGAPTHDVTGGHIPLMTPHLSSPLSTMLSSYSRTGIVGSSSGLGGQGSPQRRSSRAWGKF